MNDPQLRQHCTAYALDLPGHGKSLPGSKVVPGAYKASEDDFIGILAGFIERLNVRRPIVCGASMAGNICLAAAVRADEVKLGGVIPLEASEHLGTSHWTWDRSLHVNQSLFNPESIYPTISPTAPAKNKELLWHTYSAQAHGILAVDLDFYFRMYFFTCKASQTTTH